MDDNETRHDVLPAALADQCSLNRADLDERLREIERLSNSALRHRRDEDGGTVLTFDRAAAAQVHDLVRRERMCCAHLDFAIEETDADIRLIIRSRSDE
jgi:hypothetical protein